MMTHREALPIPTVYWITPQLTGGIPDYIDYITEKLDQGIQLIQLRAKHLSLNDYKALAKAVSPVVRAYKKTCLLLNAPPHLLNDIPADGIHLTSDRLMQLTSRPIQTQHILSAACHNSSELQQAEKLSVDIATLSPVFPTPSSPNSAQSALGWDTFKQLASLTSLRLYALGGVSTQDYDTARKAGAYGIAGIRLLNLNMQHP